MEEIEATDPTSEAPVAPVWPPYDPPADAVILDDVELLDADGVPQGCIIASAYFADYYCAHVMPGWAWRHYVPPEPEPEGEAPADPPAEDPEPVEE